MTTRSRVAGLVPLVSLVVLVSVLVAGLAWAAGPPSPPPGLDRAIAAQEAHTDALLANPHVVGTAVGLGPDGGPVVKIYTRSAGVRGLPASLDGVPVQVEVTGEFVAQGVGDSSGTERLIVYRGSLYCTVGTLGALVKDGAGVVYTLSNAHVYANEGSKTSGAVVTGAVAGEANADRILQPGRVDMQPACGNDGQVTEATIGTLWTYKPIVFSRTANNQIDAAIAKLAPSVTVNNATPSDGYGTPRSSVATPTLGQAVQKYGRTTGPTEGVVTSLNATVLIRYDKGLARFKGQIVIQGDGAFSDGGDSGALIVTKSLVDSLDRQPVALLFAGSSSSTIGNPIQAVLDGFFGPYGLSIVGD